jgi:hypothetical protein
VLDRSPDSVQETGPKPLFLKAEVDSREPYVQQVIDYRIKIYFSREPQRAVLSDPQVEGASIQQAGEDRAYDERVDGQSYRVIERRYRVTPQRSGTLRIASPRLEAMLPDPNPGARQDPFAELDEAFGGTLFQSFPRIPGVTHPGKRVVERAEDLEFQVRPQPAGSGSPWLPATSIEVADEWTPSPPRLRVGEPVTRTLTITAEGATAAQLPTLSLGAISGAQVYPDQPRVEDLDSGAVPAAVKTLKVALVPTRAGQLRLPEIRLPWWDTKANVARVVVIPERTLEVAPGPAGSAPLPVAASEAASPDAIEAPAAVAESSSPSVVADAPGSAVGGEPWPWVALAIGLGWLATLVWWYRDRRARSKRPEPVPAASVPSAAVVGGSSLKAAASLVERACAASDPRAARSALIDWASLRWPEDPPHGLEALAARVGDEPLAELLRSIDRAIYAPPGVGWDGSRAWESLAPALARLAQSAKPAGEAAIPDLYPGT